MPLDVLYHCLAHTQCKLVVVDSERADRLEPSAPKLIADVGTTGFLVLEAHEGKGRWKGMRTWEEALNSYGGNSQSILVSDPNILPEDNASILFTSGMLDWLWFVVAFLFSLCTRRYDRPAQRRAEHTTPVAHKYYERETLNCDSFNDSLNRMQVLVGSRRAALRRGEDLPVPIPGPQKSMLISVPLFHVTGSTSLTVGGFTQIFMGKCSDRNLDDGYHGRPQDCLDAEMGHQGR